MRNKIAGQLQLLANFIDFLPHPNADKDCNNFCTLFGELAKPIWYTSSLLMKKGK